LSGAFVKIAALLSKETVCVNRTESETRQTKIILLVNLLVENVENTRLRLVFSTFPLCSKMPVVFYHSVIHGLGFFLSEIKRSATQTVLL